MDAAEFRAELRAERGARAVAAAGGWRRVLLAAALLVGICLLALREPILRHFWPGELIQPIDTDLQVVAIFIGTFIGVLAAAWTVARQSQGHRRDDDDRDSIGPVVAPALALIAPVLLATATARWTIEQAAFAGLAPTAVLVEFTVVGVESATQESGARLRLRWGTAGRVVSLPVSDRVQEAARVGDHVALPVQTGRRGIQRMVPDRRLVPGDLHHAG